MPAGHPHREEGRFTPARVDPQRRQNKTYCQDRVGLGHKNIANTVPYSRLSADRFKGFDGRIEQDYPFSSITFLLSLIWPLSMFIDLANDLRTNLSNSPEIECLADDPKSVSWTDATVRAAPPFNLGE